MSVQISPKLCAHRGFNVVAPENTLPAFMCAYALGADEIEFDLWPDAEGKLIVCHDPTVNRTTNGQGEINVLSTKYLKGLDAGIKFSPDYSGVCLPSFEEVLRLLGGKVKMNIHIKSLCRPMISDTKMLERGRLLEDIYLHQRSAPKYLLPEKGAVIPEMESRNLPPYTESVFQKILDLIDQYQCRNWVYFTGEKDVLTTALKMAPDIERCCLEGHMNFSIIQHALELQCRRVQFCKLFLTEEMIKEAHKNNLICNLFWSDTPEEAKYYVNKGIDVVLTNHCLALKKHFG
ncbi:glycerophosphodiester phosphodiesterase [Angelakisella massiliensis]|uniref:glycerophosphodiester phosphodiesterase n=1 Tax=Angelakisella massiliensis TaxID=1871018 RepID=UPI0008F85690|nr:glycerophosphodiester phosphodiesterase family protein [Angelakisella massiliensis]